MGFELVRCKRCGSEFMSDGTDYKCSNCGFVNSWDNPEYRRLVQRDLGVGCIREACRCLRDALSSYSEYFTQDQKDRMKQALEMLEELVDELSRGDSC